MAQVDLLGWSLGGVVAQHVALRPPELVRRFVVVGSGSGMTPDMPPMANQVLEIMAKSDVGENDLMYLFYSETDAARAAGAEHLAKVSKRLSEGGPAVSEIAASRQLEAIDKAWSLPWEHLDSACSCSTAMPGMTSCSSTPKRSPARWRTSSPADSAADDPWKGHARDFIA